MGLDMYLTRRVYLGGHYAYNRITGSVDIAVGGRKVDVDLNLLDELIFHAGYWRKANQIHKWFVDNVQDGEDDCREYNVAKEQLRELRDLCASALETKDASLLPPQSGFFFGSTEIDDDYWNDLRRTIEIIKKLDLEDYYSEFYYRSSW